MNVPNHALVLVADGRKMLFLRNHGNAAHIDLRIEVRCEQDNPPNRDQASDAPGRSFESVGSRRSGMEETDFHQIQEDRFAAKAAELLNARALANDFETLIVVAPPHTLGELRKSYHKQVASRIIKEIDKDLTGCPIDEIEAMLAKIEAN